MDEDRYEYVMEALGVIARLTENRRLTIRSGHVDIDNDRKLQFLRRRWNSIDREVCLNKVRQIFNEGIHMARAALNEMIALDGASATGNVGTAAEVSNILIKERSGRRYGRLSEALESASHGIETHKVTYKNDDRFCALVEVLVGNIRDQLHDMEMHLKMKTIKRPRSQAMADYHVSRGEMTQLSVAVADYVEQPVASSVVGHIGNVKEEEDSEEFPDEFF